jgi:hypothetical protein
MIYWLSVVVCLVSCVGCSTVKPAQSQSAATPAVQAQTSAPHNYPMKWFVHGWLMGDAPPPDYNPGNYKDEWGSGVVGLAYLVAQCCKK